MGVILKWVIYTARVASTHSSSPISIYRLKCFGGGERDDIFDQNVLSAMLGTVGLEDYIPPPPRAS